MTKMKERVDSERKTPRPLTFIGCFPGSRFRGGREESRKAVCVWVWVCGGGGGGCFSEMETMSPQLGIHIAGTVPSTQKAAQ